MKKFISVLLVFMVVMVTLVSCNKDTSSNNDSDKNSGTVTFRPVENLSEYVIVRAEKTSKEATAAAHSISKAIKDSIGVSIDVKTDKQDGTYEILVGMTKREESVAAHKDLRYFDYVIRKTGNKIVIAAGSDEALVEAVKVFKEKFIVSEKQKLYAPAGADYWVKKKYALDAFSVNGVDISKFTIVNQGTAQDLSALTNGVCKVVGVGLDISTDTISDDGYYISVDSTSSVINKYSITVDDRNITIKASPKSLSTALEAFVALLNGADAKSYNLTAADSFEGTTKENGMYTKAQLLQVLDQVYADPNKVIIGQQAKGSKKTKDPDGVAVTLEEFKKATGQMPGIIGIDLGCYGFDLMSVSEAEWSQYIGDLVEFAYGGGIVTISSHWANPSGNVGTNDSVRGELGYDDTLEGYQKAFTDLITEGTEYNTAFKTELDLNARFLKALQDNGVPVIWRPLHEANGSWFWYCIRPGVDSVYTLDPSYFINVWKYVYKYFTEEWGLTELIWCYSPNYSKNVNDAEGSTMSAMYLYPGDEYCDIVGVDWYSNGELEITLNDNYSHFVDQTGKTGALAEFGPGDLLLTGDVTTQTDVYNCMDLYEDLMELADKNYSFAYLLTWTTRYGVTGMGLGDEFMETDYTLGQAEVKAMFDALK